MNLWSQELCELINDDKEEVIIKLKDGTIIDTSFLEDCYVKHEYDYLKVNYDDLGENVTFYIPDNSVCYFRVYKSKEEI